MEHEPVSENLTENGVTQGSTFGDIVGVVFKDPGVIASP